MAEVCRAQLWQWRHHGVEVTDGQVLDAELLGALIDEEFAELRIVLDPEQTNCAHYQAARDLLRSLVLDDDYPEFLTIPAYEHL